MSQEASDPSPVIEPAEQKAVADTPPASSWQQGDNDSSHVVSRVVTQTEQNETVIVQHHPDAGDDIMADVSPDTTMPTHVHDNDPVTMVIDSDPSQQISSPYPEIVVEIAENVEERTVTHDSHQAISTDLQNTEMSSVTMVTDESDGLQSHDIDNVQVSDSLDTETVLSVQPEMTESQIETVSAVTSHEETMNQVAHSETVECASDELGMHQTELHVPDAETQAFSQETSHVDDDDDSEETTTIFAYIDSEGNLRGRSSTGEDVLLQVQGDMPDELSPDALMEDNGNVVVIQNCDPDSMLHTDGDVTYIVQQQSDDDSGEASTTAMDASETASVIETQGTAPAGTSQDESATAAANLVYFEEEACSLETAEFQIVGVEVETQGGDQTPSEPSIIIDGCQVICQEPPQVKKKRSPSKSSETSPTKSNGKPKKPRKRKSSQKDTAGSLPESDEPKEKVTVQNLYDKSIEMCITENSSSQNQTAEAASEALNKDNVNVPVTMATEETAVIANMEVPQAKPKKKKVPTATLR